MGEAAIGEGQTLDTLAAEINSEHQAFIGSLRKTAEHGIRCGALLTEAKKQCKHGEWSRWLQENFAGSQRTAQEYIRLYKHRDEIRAKTRGSAHLSISGALHEISTATTPMIDEVNESLHGDPYPEDQRMWEAFKDGVRELNREARQETVGETTDDMTPVKQKTRLAEPIDLPAANIDTLWGDFYSKLDPEASAQIVLRQRPDEAAEVEVAASMLIRWLERFTASLATTSSREPRG